MNAARNLILLLVVLVCAGSFWLARRGDPAAVPSPPTPAVATDGDEIGDWPTVSVAVLNGTGEAGLARRASRLLPPIGAVVTSVADAPHDTFSASLLVNRRLDPGRIRALAAALGGIRVISEWDSRCDEDAVLVLGRDHRRVLAALDTAP